MFIYMPRCTCYAIALGWVRGCMGLFLQKNVCRCLTKHVRIRGLAFVCFQRVYYELPWSSFQMEALPLEDWEAGPELVNWRSWQTQPEHSWVGEMAATAPVGCCVHLLVLTAAGRSGRLGRQVLPVLGRDSKPGLWCPSGGGIGGSLVQPG